MASCNYRVLNDIYGILETELDSISQKIENVELSIDIAELDVDLDNLEKQLEISNKLKLLELIGIDIMSEEEQTEAYQSIMEELFGIGGSAGGMVEDPEELDGPTEFEVETPAPMQEEDDF